MIPSRRLVPAFALLVGFAHVVPAAAEKIAHPVAVFTGLDKITGRIITFDVYVDETVQFGALRVTPRVCYSRPATEAAQTDAFVEVDEITLNSEVQRIFMGWMFAASPGLNAVEHPVYDVWLNDCRESSDVPPPGQRDGAARTAAANPDAPENEGAPGLEMVDGVPIPRVKPTITPSAEDEVPLPTLSEGGEDVVPPGEILD
jgi:hypothetical protein